MEVDNNAMAKLFGGTVSDDGKIVVKDLAMPETEPTEDVQEAEEEPAVAPIVEEKKIETPIVEQPVVVTKTFEEQFRERFGEDFNEEVVSKYKAPKVDFANETVAKLNEFIKGYDDPKQAMEVFMSTQITDYNSKTDSLELIAMKYKLDHPQLSTEDINELIRGKYKIDDWAEEGEAPTVEEKRMKIQMKLDGESSKKDLIANQQKWAVTPAKKVEVDTQLKQQEQTAHVDAWKATVKNSLTDYKKESFLLDKDNFDYDVTDVNKVESSINDFVLNPTKFIVSRYTDSTGKTDYNKLKKEMLILDNFESILKEASAKARAEGALTVAKDLKNTDFTPDKKPNTVTRKSALQQVAEQSQINI